MKEYILSLYPFILLEETVKDKKYFKCTYIAFRIFLWIYNIYFYIFRCFVWHSTHAKYQEFLSWLSWLVVQKRTRFLWPTAFFFYRFIKIGRMPTISSFPNTKYPESSFCPIQQLPLHKNLLYIYTSNLFHMNYMRAIFKLFLVAISE